MDQKILQSALAGVVLALLAACQSGSQTAGIDRSGVRSPVAVEGPITGFGSIFVSGVRYDVSSAQVRVNGEPVSESDLALGQVVALAGQIDADNSNGVADSVVFEANVRGPVEALDAAAASLIVLGQTVRTDPGTVFDLGSDPPVLASLAVAERVEVSGFVGAGGAIIATRVARSSTPTLRVRGIARNVDTAGARFMINALALDYSGAVLVEGFPGGAPANGDEVIAVGQAIGGGGELLVQQLRLHQRNQSPMAGNKVEVEALITRFVSAADFDVATRLVTATAATVYEGGSAASLALNVKVKVDGTYDSAGTIVARKIEVKDGGRVYN